MLNIRLNVFIFFEIRDIFRPMKNKAELTIAFAFTESRNMYRCLQVDCRRFCNFTFLRRNVIKETEELIRSFHSLNIIIDDKSGCFKKEYERRMDVRKVE